MLIRDEQARVGTTHVVAATLSTRRPDALPSSIEEAESLRRADRLVEAEACYRRVLAADPSIAEAWHRLGELIRQSGRAIEAIEPARRAVSLRPDSAEYHRSLGLAALAAGRLDEAGAALRQALNCQPGRVDGLNELGIALARAGRPEDALACLSVAIRHRPELPAAHQNQGVLLRRMGRIEDAERAFLRASCLDPLAIEAQLALGQLWREQGRLTEALVAYANATRFHPSRGEGHRGLGQVLSDLGRATEAVDAFRQALDRMPRDGETLNDLGNSLRQIDRLDEAVAAYRQALRVAPDFSPPLSNLGNLLAEEGRTEEARESYRRSHESRPLDRLRVLGDLLLPVVYDSVEHIESARARFVENLDRLHADGIEIDTSRELMPTHFYLAYHGRNDHELHASVARLAKASPQIDLRRRPRTGRKIRVGFLSSYLRSHTIGQLNHGLIAGLDRSRFEVVVLSAGGAPDPGLGDRIRRSADRFVPVSSHLEAALQTVAGQELDVLYLTDIGMDTLTYTMAFSRLAPVQCATWGHPVTTGLPSVDYFLSSQDLEPEGNESHYSEKLVRLPRLGVRYERPILKGPKPSRSALGLPERPNLYACPQTLFKFHPEFDELLGGILRADPDGLLVLIEGKHPHWTDLLRRRFERTFPDVIGRVKFLPRLGRDDFLGLLAVSDVILDPIHFGGGNSSYEALAAGTPIVTLPSQFLRGRLTHAMYRQMGMTGLTVQDAEEYIQTAVRLCNDRDLRREVRRQIAETRGVLFEDDEAVRAVEQFLDAAV
ncbi:tetratricopeptide repeat protein [Tundrisphaera lichenicola]|uniref:tetratricopeptide repeat protein n=1 Tax=Tundrisphaera lichenicola TaxID=2029860 RepID=UPI003EC0D7E4